MLESGNSSKVIVANEPLPTPLPIALIPWSKKFDYEQDQAEHVSASFKFLFSNAFLHERTYTLLIYTPVCITLYYSCSGQRGSVDTR